MEDQDYSEKHYSEKLRRQRVSAADSQRSVADTADEEAGAPTASETSECEG